jgi:hypothetical protein|nr:hypothetical protein [Candidatus Krumholzibacteria bacterium]
MSSIVAIVETRPETVREDYARALELAGGVLDPESTPLLCTSGRSRNFRPGFGTAPWQLDAVADFWKTGGDEPAAFSHLDTGQTDAQALVPVRSGLTLPALGACVTGGFHLPADLLQCPLVLLPVPRLNAEWMIEGAVAQVVSLMAGQLRRPKRIPFAEMVAEAFALVWEQAGPLCVAMDGVAWGIRRQDGHPHALLRNVILTGDDPVAVDATAARLAGLDPRRIPWLQLCQDRRLGWIDPQKIQVRGRKDLLDLDFQLPEGTFTPVRSAGTILSWPGRALGRLGRRRQNEALAGSAWGRLLDSYSEKVTP